MKLDLYYTTTACSLAAHIALEEAGAVFTSHYVKLGDPERQSAFMAISPAGKVPVLIADGVLITENPAILWFVARLLPQHNLIPNDPVEEAQCLSLLSWFASTVQIDRRQARAPSRFVTDEEAYPALAAAGRTKFGVHVERIDAMLSTRTWLLGDNHSVADCYAFVFWAWAIADQQPAAALSNISDWSTRMLERPAVQRVLSRERHPLLRTTG